MYGYHYLAEAVYEQIKEDKVIKSACTVPSLIHYIYNNINNP